MKEICHFTKSDDLFSYFCSHRKCKLMVIVNESSILHLDMSKQNNYAELVEILTKFK